MAQFNTPDRAASTSTCNNASARQQERDAKAFTGRGGTPTELRQAAARVDRIHRAQDDLSRLTRRVRGRTFYLSLHRRKATGQVHLRWRAAGAGPHAGHIPWDKIDAYFVQLPGTLREWYERTHRRALELNRREIEARLALKHARQCDP
ncbi:hypothetical protein GPA22_01000 [Aromatoleum toluvorans]|uniref:Uncharacterized protein n=1 Tax=Aromatoleum toluvorans TaxID=92002 RepID=A0ABX1PS93_9RHOO|nr:hypothetical protein [Aromatoleum toluvorans]NMG42314.1 hypothetical protein [Aromatoleum toluvorans]